MRNFVWSCFQVTGSIDAYLLYKNLEAIHESEEQAKEELDEEESG
ncbi:YqzL family protein [Thermoactinomyces mirandus]|uniref:YqzL family protein n=1 Tax=Thermoactinomyces mirandus TaxID=2756294 RepID=A0A7W1XP77_9BACL|nr:YqzL family protein [Thermoactinomyces mirandus]MBA4600748.1 YqzL family protein [Thermoactinomyces mirandus]